MSLLNSMLIIFYRLTVHLGFSFKRYEVKWKSSKINIVEEIFSNYDWRYKEFINLFNKIDHDVKVVVDIGANCGLFSALASKKFNKSKCILFEPQLNLLNYLVSLRSVNHFNWTIISTAVSNKTRLIKVNTEVPDDQAYIEAGGSNDDYLSAAVQLDTALIFLDSIDLMKIDVEGVELSVIQGGKKVLSKTRTLIIEFQPDLLKRNGHNSLELYNEIMKSGFTNAYCLQSGYEFDPLVENKACDVVFTR